MKIDVRQNHAILDKAGKLETTNVLKSHAAVYVGANQVYVGVNQMKPFVVPISNLNHPLKKLDFGFDHPMGGLSIPCEEDTFIYLTS
ncbi:hypothetical protein AQUCO_01500310v1 [Aquilegia coerulea]|uniref:Auxin-responsive protein n=1 Tax=Aquilegia coerulea TaxID=218851 RepID=A0A2G5DT44_AQUCA|nr:hypothetical protein AQUCO_01500310v1 [Aquilegia coerulea]